MAQEFTTHTIDLKSMDQDIQDFVVGAGDVNGRTLRVIITQEARKQITKSSHLYLSWHHQQLDIRGLNVFKFRHRKPATWILKYPPEMLYEGDVLCTIKLIDKFGIVQSSDFIVHVLRDPDDGSRLTASDDYNLFQEAALELNNTNEEMRALLSQYAEALAANQAKLEELFGSGSEEIQDVVDNIESKLEEAVNEVKDNIVTIEEF